MWRYLRPFGLVAVLFFISLCSILERAMTAGTKPSTRATFTSVSNPHLDPPACPPCVPAGTEIAPPPRLEGINDAANKPAVFVLESRNINLPVSIDPDVRAKLKEVRLHVSRDEGVTWKRDQTSMPDATSFIFVAPADGLYCFAVQTVDLVDTLVPSQLMPEIRVQVRVDQK